MYNPVLEQCDADPDITADGSKIDIPNASDHMWIAVSRDLLARNGGPFNFGDTVVLIADENLGTFQVRDVMNSKWRRRIDILETEGTPPYRHNNVTIVKL
jgi:hypothetical protein